MRLRILVASVALLSIGTILYLPKVTSSTSEVVGSQRDNDADLIALRAYKQWQLVNPKREFMAPNAAQLCARNVGRDVESHHLNKYISVFVNNVGEKAMMSQRNPRFPEGTMIVKEKFGSVDGKEPEILTAMIKRSPGYNARTGDWEYFLLDGPANQIDERGKLERCMSCHLMYQKNDFVVRSYLPEDVRGKLK